jgi:hypothetical protein
VEIPTLNNKKYIFQYHKKVWSRANRETDSYFRHDLPAWIGGAISAIATGLLTAYFLNLINGDNMPFWITSLIVSISTIFGLAFFIVVMFGWKGLWEVPAKMFQEKEEELKLFTWDTSSISLQYFDIASGEKGWAIKIENNKKFPMIAKSKPIEVSKNGESVFNENGHWAMFGFINRKDGLIREKVVHCREMRDYKTHEKFLPSIAPNDFIELVLTKLSDDGKYIFETDQDKILTNPEDSVLKLEIGGWVVIEDKDFFLPKITMLVKFDSSGVPEMVSRDNEN